MSETELAPESGPEAAPATAPEGAPEPERIEALELEVASLRAQLDTSWVQLQNMRSSASWRVTYPLRVIRRLWPR